MRWSAVLFLGAGLLIGCGKQGEKAKTKTPGTVPPTAVEKAPSVTTAADQKAAAEAAATAAQDLLEKFRAALKGGKLDEAEGYLTQLDARRDTLTDALKEQLTAAHTALVAAKTAKALEAPKVETPKVEQPKVEAPDATEATVKEARSLIEQILDLIKGGKLDQAAVLMKRLEDMKGKLPEAVQNEVAGASKALDVAKKADAIKPELPKLPPIK